MKRLVERLLIKILKKMNVNLLVHAHVQEAVGHNTFSSGEDDVIKNYLAQILGKTPRIVFDVGANIGTYAQTIAEVFPGAKIYSFEPVPLTFETLVAATKNLNVTTINSAVGSVPGELDIYFGKDNANRDMASAHKAALETIFRPVTGEVSEKVTVPVITLDDYFKDEQANIDFLKIDVEGYEKEVLQGAFGLITANRISIIQFEFNEFNIFSKTFMFDFYRLLPEFKFYRITPAGKLKPMGDYNSALEIFRYQNIWAVRKEFEVKV